MRIYIKADFQCRDCWFEWHETDREFVKISPVYCKKCGGKNVSFKMRPKAIKVIIGLYNEKGEIVWDGHQNTPIHQEK